MDFEKLKKAKLKKGISDKGWNKHLPNPLLPEEIVYVHPDQGSIDTKRFIRIIHSEERVTSVFSLEYFEQNI